MSGVWFLNGVQAVKEEGHLIRKLFAEKQKLIETWSNNNLRLRPTEK